MLSFGRCLLSSMTPCKLQNRYHLIKTFQLFLTHRWSSLGIAFDPLDTKSDPDVYFTANTFFHKGKLSSSGTTINGRILKASGASLENVTTIVSGLPVSDLDHGLNAIEFGDHGELYMCMGSHTNGGIPGPLSSSRLLKENFLSAAINVAYLSHPDFNGDIRWSAPDDGNMIAKGIDVFAHGVRNAYGIVLHSNGKMYATENGPNTGYGKMSTGCGPNDVLNDIQTSDRVLHIQEGHYYGHPNRKRAEFFKDPRQCVWNLLAVNSTKASTAMIGNVTSSRNGIIEFHGNHFGGQLRGNLIFARYNKESSLSRVVLSEDGLGLTSTSFNSIPMGIGSQGLDVTQAPNGNLIEMQMTKKSLGAFAPDEAATLDLVVKTVFPRRGGYAGGSKLSIYGVNFFINGQQTSVTVGQSACPVASVTLTEIICTLPGGVGTVDVTVKRGIATSTFENGYRYISGLPPPGFTIPEFK
jgi:glucose/arabinose dehydrogenase